MNDLTEAAELPAITDDDIRASGFPAGVTMAPGLALFFNDRIYKRCRAVAIDMSEAQGFMPTHLLGKPAACFAVVSMSITWNLSPYMVGQCTYMTPGGRIGLEGKLVTAILENSGRLDGSVKFTHEGDWDKLKGKFEIKEGQRGGKYAAPTWTREDAKGLRVIVSARVKGESDDRTLPFDLDEAFPLNSPLWGTSPRRQICYTAARAFANIAMPGVLMGVPFDLDPFEASQPMTDITPARPTRERNEFVRSDDTATADKKTVTQTKPAETPTSEEQPESEQPATGEEPPTAESQPQQQGAEARATEVAATAEAYETLKRELAAANRIPDVADLRKSASPVLITKEREQEWDKLCDARTKAILAASAGQGTSGKPRNGKR